MKIFKFLMAFFIVVAFFRAMNGAGDFSFTDLVTDLQGFRFDTEPLLKFIRMFSGGELGLFSWDASLTGIDGFFVNMGNFFAWLFSYAWQLLVQLFDAVWNTVSELMRLVYSLIKLVFDVFGYSLALQ